MTIPWYLYVALGAAVAVLAGVSVRLLSRLVRKRRPRLVYDYKTFSVEPLAIPELAQEYHEHQLQVYARAAAALYPDRKVRTFLLFTSLPSLVPTGWRSLH